MTIAIIQFPGSNCERETHLAVKRAGMTPVDFLWNEAINSLGNFSGYILIGGFSYEDRIRAGLIASLDPLINALKLEAQAGKPILGICNGAQILVESGLVPGFEDYPLAMALTHNKRLKGETLIGTGYYNDWIYCQSNSRAPHHAFSCAMPTGTILRLPVAHAEGRFIMPKTVLNCLQTHQVATFHYCDETGKQSEHFPTNPNGAINNLAAVSNFQGNVMAMMPHPERTEGGDLIFESMRQFITNKRTPKRLISPAGNMG